MSSFPHRLAYVNNVDGSLFVRHVSLCFVGLVVEGMSGMELPAAAQRVESQDDALS
jgi:uncharacterized protein YjeT (DUF2065 family)